MRRNEREIQERDGIDAVIRDCRICRVGLCDGAEPYVVPLCFGYDGKSLYFHGAPEGRKLDVLRKNSRVCFEFDIIDELVKTESGCGWSMKYRSVIGAGRAEIVEDLEEKRHGLDVLMSQYSDRSFSFGENSVRRVCVIKVAIDSISGKQSVE